MRQQNDHTPPGRSVIGARTIRQVFYGALAVILTLTGLTLGAGAASAAPVYEITGQWTPGTPDQGAKGDVVTAEWRVNINDDAAAPSNDPVDNMTFTATLEHGNFKGIPDLCLTTGVDPASNISDDGKTLTCNLGTVNQGSALVVQTPVVLDGVTGDTLTAKGSIAGIDAELTPIEIANTFGMDMLWGTPSPQWQQVGTNDYDFGLQWTLNLLDGSDAGPDSVSYDLTITNNNSFPLAVAPRACDAYYPSNGVADGHPFSAGVVATPANTAPFVDECTLVKTGADTYRLTLTGIDYSLTTVPTEDSAGNTLPTDRSAVASGSVWLRISGMTAVTAVTLTSNAPTYTSVTGLTSTDDPANNTSGKTITLPGGWSSAWHRPFTGSGGGAWDNTYGVSAGTTVASILHDHYGRSSRPGGDTPVQDCTILDTRFATYDSWYTDWDSPGEANERMPENLQQVTYYIGSSPLLDPASGQYNPNAFDCATATGWTATEPADKSLVKAVKVQFRAGDIVDKALRHYVLQQIKPTAPTGMDVWTWHDRNWNNGWTNVGRDTDGTNAITPVPDARYPYTTGYRDVLHVIVATPAVTKTVDRSVVRPGVPATYTLTYSANGSGVIGPEVDDFELVDTLPAGMSYVAGSASPEPAISTSGGQQVLTWDLDDVPTNAPQTLTYQSVAGDSVEPGVTLTNSVDASVAGVTSKPSTAQVTVSTSGYTDIGKVADQAFIPNLNGDGVGEGSWTVTLRSFDPLPQAYTDTIDILPYVGDERGTSFSGTYELTSVDAVAGATVYYTTADPATLSDDPGDDSNGSAGNVAGNTVDWSTTYTADATAVRVIGPELAPGAIQKFTLHVATDGAVGGDLLVNRAQARDGHTQLKMRTSAPVSIANYYSASLKKYVQDSLGEWHDANDVTDYPAMKYGEDVNYRIVVTNTGQGTLTNVDITDDRNPKDGSFHIDELAPGKEQVHEFTMVLDENADSGTIVNTACGSADIPADSQVAPTINCDPAGLEVANYTTVKTSDPKPGATVEGGDTVTYTVTVTQEGPVAADAVFTDDLSDVLDDAAYNRDVTSSIGKATVKGNTLSWAGTIPVDKVATITYSVTVDDDVAGDAELLNVVTSPGCEVVDGATPYCNTEHPADAHSAALPDTGAGSLLPLLLALSLMGVGGFTLVLARGRKETIAD